MKIKIPSDIVPRQVNKGEKYGDIWASWNLDLTSNIGKIRISPRLSVISSTDSIATLTNPVAMIRSLADSPSVDTIFAVCSQKIVKAPVSTFTFSADSSGPTTGLSNLYSDMTGFDGTLFISQKTDLAILANGTWDNDWFTTILSGTLTNNTPHPLCSGFTKELLIGNGNKIISINKLMQLDSERLILPSEFEVQWIRSSNSAYWIGCRNKVGGEGNVFMWDGASEYVNGDYKIGSPITFAGVIKDEIPYTINGNGQLMVFTGGGFEELDRFPVANEGRITFNDNFSNISVNINRNGMAVVDGNINILVSAGIQDINTSTFLENMLSGIWEYTPETGLYHKYSISKGDNQNMNDYGSPKLVQAGALMPVVDNYRKFLVGAELNQNETPTEVSVINGISYTGSDDVYNKLGYFITPQYHTQELEENWQTLYLNISKLLNSGDYVEVKYRTSKEFVGEYDSATWLSANSFNITDTDFADVNVGDEVEILSGEGSGLSSNISGITGTYNVELDRNITGASGALILRTSNWTKIDTITDLNKAYEQFSIQKNSNWIQFKIVMYGKNDSPEIEKLTLVSTPQLKTI